MKKNDMAKMMESRSNIAPSLQTLGGVPQIQEENRTPTKEEVLAQIKDSDLEELIKKIYEVRTTRGRGRARVNTDDDAKITFACSRSQVEKLKCIAFYEHITLKKLLFDMFQDYINKYEEENGEIGDKRLKL